MLLAIGAARADEDDRRRQAAQAYGEAENAVLAGDFSRAASLFERANDIIPTPQALRMAVQMRMAADQPRLAAQHAEELLRRYPYDLTSRSLALEILDQMSGRFVRVFVTCDEECAIRVDRGRASEPRRSHVIYLPPGRHTLDAIFDGDVLVTKRIRRPAGQAVTLSFQRPETPSEAAGAEATGTNAAGTETTGASRTDTGATRDRSGLDDTDRETGPVVMTPRRQAAGERIEPPRVPLAIGGLLTAGLGAATVWSHRDALAIEQGAAGDASGARRRTQLLLGATALSAAATVAVSVIWARLADAPDEPGSRDHLGLGVTADAGSYWVGMAGTF